MSSAIILPSMLSVKSLKKILVRLAKASLNCGVVLISSGLNCGILRYTNTHIFENSGNKCNTSKILNY